ncbi:hypothetical protein COEREDRAFT_11771 [Coemansia reversa NRRL 1564]|uniref:Uncharacterized protein n=1 Tax=Coemansia reversa (strain ATCC 12441 / NRRL 1564) TaxID=763665 RepID=A0A2G5B292_COERN|nr:hypothetical protein COEREDRAFT_11771 [Coemansia reversa NRRL 1564]|eukprot:PIA13115.1 hypothetical protein COEREDRAFT_11771 [Coemansia reversa NRRL 1564]
MEPPLTQSLSQPYGPTKSNYALPQNIKISPPIGPQDDSDVTLQVPLVENSGFKPHMPYQQNIQPQKQQQQVSPIQISSQQQQQQQVSPVQIPSQQQTQQQQQMQMPQAHMQVPVSNADHGVQGISQPNPLPSYAPNTIAPNEASVDPYHHNFIPGTFGPNAQNYNNHISAAPLGVNYVNTYSNAPPQISYPHMQSVPLVNTKPYAAFDHSNPFHSSNNNKFEHNVNANTDHHSSVSSAEPSGLDNTFRNRIKDFLGNVSVCETVPMASLVTAALIHHYRHRNTTKLVPFEGPKWLRYLGNAVFARATYGFLTGNGLIKPRSKAPQESARTLSWDGRDSYSSNPHNIPNSHTIGGYTNGHIQYDMQSAPNAVAPALESSYAGGVTQMVGKIVNGLFRNRNANGMPGITNRGLNDSADILDGFDESWAVPRKLAEKYYRNIYHKGKNLYNVETYVLGGAAAISALHSEKSMVRHQLGNHSNTTKQLDYKHDYVVMGLALSEVEMLLERKSEMGPMGPGDDLESIGKIALATIIKIKTDEDFGEYEKQYKNMTSHPMTTAQYNERDHCYHSYDGRYTGANIDYEQRKLQNRSQLLRQPHHQRFPQDFRYQQNYYS